MVKEIKTEQHLVKFKCDLEALNKESFRVKATSKPKRANYILHKVYLCHHEMSYRDRRKRENERITAIT